jgi:hypothetical protein
MSQQSLLDIEYTKKIRAAAVNQAVTQLVVAKKGLSETSKRLSNRGEKCSMGEKKFDQIS